MQNFIRNKHGVPITLDISGRYYIPVICSFCKHEDHEIGEMGTVLCGSYCTKNVWFPTKKGTCKFFVAQKPLFMEEEEFQNILLETKPCPQSQQS